jgi:hypothetical protein
MMHFPLIMRLQTPKLALIKTNWEGIFIVTCE